MAKLIKASFIIHVYRLSLVKGVQEISTGHAKDKGFYSLGVGGSPDEIGHIQGGMAVDK